MILDKMVRQKRFFNVKDKKDVKSAKLFFETYSWGHEVGCPFILEYPYLTVPDMMKDKLVLDYLGIKFDRSKHWGIM